MSPNVPGVETTGSSSAKLAGRSRSHRPLAPQHFRPATPSPTPGEVGGVSLGPPARQGALCANKTDILLRMIHVPKAGGTGTCVPLGFFTLRMTMPALMFEPGSTMQCTFAPTFRDLACQNPRTRPGISLSFQGNHEVRSFGTAMLIVISFFSAPDMLTYYLMHVYIQTILRLGPELSRGCHGVHEM